MNELLKSIRNLCYSIFELTIAIVFLSIIFGEPESKENLRAFLNAILYNNIGNIKDIEIIKDKELTTDEITNKTGIIDV